MTSLELKVILNETAGCLEAVADQVANLTASEEPDLVIKTQPGSLAIANELRGRVRQLREHIKQVTVNWR